MDEPTIPSNEQIIDDLTKELRNSCATTQSNTTSTRAEYGSDDEKGDATGDIWPAGMEEEEKSDSSQNEGPCLDSIDEEALKDREVTLNDDEKQVCIFFYLFYSFFVYSLTNTNLEKTVETFLCQCGMFLYSFLQFF